jgi:hypothetical protein
MARLTKAEFIWTRAEYEEMARWADSTKENGEKPALSYEEYYKVMEKTYEYCMEREWLEERYRAGLMTQDEYIKLHDALDRRHGREETLSQILARVKAENM